MILRVVAMSSTRSPFREPVDPGLLEAHGGVVDFPPLVRQHHERRPPMVWIGLEGDEPLGGQIVGDALHVLAAGPQIAREPRHRLGSIRRHDGTEDLPASARQAKARDQAVSRGENPAVEPEQIENEAGQGGSGGRSLGFAHLVTIL